MLSVKSHKLTWLRPFRFTKW